LLTNPQIMRHPPPGAVPDSDIIVRSRTEPEVFAEIFDRHAVVLHQYVTRRLGVDTADDVVAETFLAAFRRRDKFDPAYRDARPWLFGIATNMMRRFRHTEIRQYQMLARTGVDPVLESPADEALSRVAAGAAQQALAAALAGLASGDRDTLLLIAWARLSYDEVATALGIPVGTVRSRLHRARRQVREALGGTDPTLPTEDLSHG
jgi:RNA polymerase sigma-70 factor (ECF subfamily)